MLILLAISGRRTGLFLRLFDISASQRYTCVMIPGFDQNENLPPGSYVCTVDEIEARFANNDHRRMLFNKLLRVIDILKEACCREIYLNGSFITAEPQPNDFDLCYEPTGLEPTESFRPLLALDVEARQALYGGDIFPRMPEPPFCSDHVRLWQIDKNGDAKGIIRILLRERFND